ncbi:MAG: molybdopterin-dependent oxidoreductase [Mycobacteriales bacterium]
MDLTRLLRRAGRRTNVALFGAFAGALLTGVLSFAAGTPLPARLATVAHGLLGLAVLALVPWKSVVINRASRIRVGSLVLLGLLGLCLVAGFVEVFAGYGYVAGVTPIQVHVGAALFAVPFFAWHVARHHHRQRVSRRDLSRRALMRTAGFASATAAGYFLLEGVGGWTGSVAGSRIATGSHRLPAAGIPATTWLFDAAPVLDRRTHRVDVQGSALSADELEARAGPDLRARLDCTSGWYADASWTGVAVRDLIPAALLAEAASIEVRSVTGYARRFPAGEAGSLWLVTRCEGVPLSAERGAPVRLVAPGRRGFWWVKWVASVRVGDAPSWWQPPFPLQ